MKMYSSRGPNFGDALNEWLWPRLLPDFFDGDESALFLGIGSILYDFLPRNARKVVFGSGYGGYTPVPHIDDRWAFYFVRGPVTARTLGLDPSLAIGDAAILVRSCVAMGAPKKCIARRSCRIGKARWMAIGSRPASTQACITYIPVEASTA